MPKVSASPRRRRVKYTEDLPCVTSKRFRGLFPPPRGQTIRVPIERGGEVVSNCKALIVDQGRFKFLLGVPFPQPKGKLYREFMAEAQFTPRANLSWRFCCPKCGNWFSSLYLVDQEVLCQACGKLKTRAPKARIGGPTKQARMEALAQRIAELKESERLQIGARQRSLDEDHPPS